MSLSPSEFEQYCRIAKEQGVAAFKLGELAVQFKDVFPEQGPLVERADEKTAGDWKRGPQIAEQDWED